MRERGGEENSWGKVREGEGEGLDPGTTTLSPHPSEVILRQNPLESASRRGMVSDVPSASITLPARQQGHQKGAGMGSQEAGWKLLLYKKSQAGSSSMII